MKKVGIGSFAAIAILIAYGAIIGIGGGGGDARQGADTAAAEAVKVTSRELASAYGSDRAAARRRYGDHPLEVTGRVAAVPPHVSDQAFLVLEGDDPILGLKADIAEASQPEAGSLSKGQIVTVRCSAVGEVMGAPMLKSCELLAIDSAVALASASAALPAPHAAAPAPGFAEI